ncbi:MAG: hypothetical protein H7Y11_05045 [Armatimonadetes bacterium]|nr:hypothetical protein [Anaerolineae bacterium]
MVDSPTLSLLYTANLGGQLAALPPLYTQLKALRALFAPALLLDLGGACAPEVWHCAATEGRSMLVALDGLGYTAANAAGLSPASRAKLIEQTALGLVGDSHTYIHGACLFALTPTVGDGHLCVLLTPSVQTQCDGHTLWLETVSSGQIGVVTLVFGAEVSIQSREIHSIPLHTPPDPTIAGMVDFIEAEARFYQRKGQS